MAKVQRKEMIMMKEEVLGAERKKNESLGCFVIRLIHLVVWACLLEGKMKYRLISAFKFNSLRAAVELKKMTNVLELCGGLFLSREPHGTFSINLNLLDSQEVEMDQRVKKFIGSYSNFF